jgi:acetyl-CoA C-acetyltransferase
MSRAPYLLEKARTGYRMGNGELVDAMIRDGLWDVYNNVHMGTCGDTCAKKAGISRQQQDDFAAASFKRALAAMQSGAFDEEIISVDAPAGKGDGSSQRGREPQGSSMRKSCGNFVRRSARKERSRRATRRALMMAPRRSVVLSEQRAKAMGTKPQARILGYATASREPEWFTLAPIGAMTKLLDQLSLKVSDIDLFEINEAFSVVALAAMKELGIPHEKVNVNGGAVALGHPIGASGCRTLVTLLHALRQRKARIGIDVLCIGGGEAVAMAVEAI